MHVCVCINAFVDRWWLQGTVDVCRWTMDAGELFCVQSSIACLERGEDRSEKQAAIMTHVHAPYPYNCFILLLLILGIIRHLTCTTL